jgi:hypothetical protein
MTFRHPQELTQGWLMAHWSAKNAAELDLAEGGCQSWLGSPADTQHLAQPCRSGLPAAQHSRRDTRVSGGHGAGTTC